MFDALAFLRDNNIQYYEEGNNVSRGWVGIRCPLCFDHSNHGGFNVAGGYYYCWKCGGHSLVEVVRELLSVSIEDAEATIDDYSGRMAVLQKLKEKRQARAKNIELPGEPMQMIHRKYLRRRGFEPRHIEEKYHVLGTGPAGDFKLRLIIPIIYKGQVVSFTGRDITGEQKLRYKTLSIEESVINPKHVLYNLDNCTGEQVCLVEGPTDVWRMGDGFCSSLGTQLTGQQIRLLADYRKVVILFDSEVEAQRRAERYAAALGSLGVEKAVVVDVETDKDPGSFSPEKAEWLREEVKRL